MKATKALLALAIMMVAIMPSCKKEDFTKSSTNPYIAVFKTAEESIGKKTEDSDKLMKEAGWSYIAEDAEWTKKVDDLRLEMEYLYNTSNVIYMANFSIESASGKTKTFSDKNYISLLNMIGQSYNINTTACEFAAAGYGDSEDNKYATKFTNYNDFKKAFSKFVAAPYNEAAWGGDITGIALESETDGSKLEWDGTIVDLSLY